jgi:hypothetical protein
LWLRYIPLRRCLEREVKTINQILSRRALPGSGAGVSDIVTMVVTAIWSEVTGASWARVRPEKAAAAQRMCEVDSKQFDGEEDGGWLQSTLEVA